MRLLEKDRIWARIVGYVSLSVVLLFFGLVDYWICRALGLSAFVVCMVHGVLLGMYVLENWVLLRDLRAKLAPIVALIDKNAAQAGHIEQLANEKRALEMEIAALRRPRKARKMGWIKDWESCDSFLSKIDEHSHPKKILPLKHLF